MILLTLKDIIGLALLAAVLLACLILWLDGVRRAAERRRRAERNRASTATGDPVAQPSTNQVKETNE